MSRSLSMSVLFLLICRTSLYILEVAQSAGYQSVLHTLTVMLHVVSRNSDSLSWVLSAFPGCALFVRSSPHPAPRGAPPREPGGARPAQGLPVGGPSGLLRAGHWVPTSSSAGATKAAKSPQKHGRRRPACGREDGSSGRREALPRLRAPPSVNALPAQIPQCRRAARTSGPGEQVGRRDRTEDYWEGPRLHPT